ncbi:ATP-grasp domain-containing protein [Spirochaeta africana]|nr:ATP-grasp domain-containing protein [Spirochaeta africana]
MMALVIAHSLGKQGVEVISCDDVDLTVMSFSRYVTKTFVHAPIKDDPQQFLDDLEEKIRRFAPKDDRPYVLMPVFRETELLAQHRERFEPLITLAAPDYSAIRQVHPKDRLLATARSLQVHIPQTWDPGNKQELEELLPTISFPVLIKPTDQVGGRGILKVNNPSQLRREFAASADRYRHPPLVQQLVGGDDYCLTVLYEKGQRKASMAYRNIHRFPAESGAGSFRETVSDEPFLPVADALFGPLGWNGIAELDFRWDGTATPYLIEVNPRFWAGLFQSVASGIDFPYALYRLAVTGHAPEPNAATIGQRTKIPGLWLFGAVRSIAESDKQYTSLSEAWQKTQDKIRNREIRELFRSLQESSSRRSSLGSTLALLRRVIRQGRSAKNDIFFRDDPFVVLGVLFVMASLIRHRRLPPEVTRR